MLQRFVIAFDFGGFDGLGVFNSSKSLIMTKSASVMAVVMTDTAPPVAFEPAGVPVLWPERTLHPSSRLFAVHPVFVTDRWIVWCCSYPRWTARSKRKRRSADSETVRDTDEKIERDCVLSAFGACASARVLRRVRVTLLQGFHVGNGKMCILMRNGDANGTRSPAARQRRRAPR